MGVAKVTREDLFKQVTVAGEFRPYLEVALPAKVTGYVSKMNVDFGDTVKAGQLLATIEIPELQAELDNAHASEQKAQADYTNANLIYSRLQSVNHEHPDLVAQQDLDTAQANELATAASIAAAKANVEKYQTMVSYTQITAPFDGVITHRYADPGTLIDAQGKPLVQVSDNYRLRLDFPVTVDYAKDVKLGDPVTVCVDSLNGKTFTGKISRFTHEVDATTRTMLSEIEVPNPGLELIPGMYATVVMKVEKHPQALAVATEAVEGGKTHTIYVVNRDHHLEERDIQLGLETPDKYEVLSACRKVIWSSSATVRVFKPVRKWSPSSSQAPGGMSKESNLNHMKAILTSEQLEILRRLDACTLANAIETFEVRLRNEGFTDCSIHCQFPKLPPMLGYAATVKVRGSAPPTADNPYLDRTDWWDYVLSLPGPRWWWWRMWPRKSASVPVGQRACQHPARAGLCWGGDQRGGARPAGGRTTGVSSFFRAAFPFRTLTFTSLNSGRRFKSAG